MKGEKSITSRSYLKCGSFLFGEILFLTLLPEAKLLPNGTLGHGPGSQTVVLNGSPPVSTELLQLSMTAMQNPKCRCLLCSVGITQVFLIVIATTSLDELCFIFTGS